MTDFDRVLGEALVSSMGEALTMAEGIPEETKAKGTRRISEALDAPYGMVQARTLPSQAAPLAGEPAASGSGAITARILHTHVQAVEGYDVLAEVLATAYLQAATGKGRERHSTGPLGFQPWHLQPIMQMGRMVGPGGHAYQIQKKAQESVTMAGNKNFMGAKAEALGAIVYAAALFRLYAEQEEANGGT